MPENRSIRELKLILSGSSFMAAAPCRATAAPSRNCCMDRSRLAWASGEVSVLARVEELPIRPASSSVISSEGSYSPMLSMPAAAVVGSWKVDMLCWRAAPVFLKAWS